MKNQHFSQNNFEKNRDYSKNQSAIEGRLRPEKFHLEMECYASPKTYTDNNNLAKNDFGNYFNFF